MADAKITKIGINSAVTSEKDAMVEEAAKGDGAAPNISERRVEGKKEVAAPNGTKIIVENL